MAYKIKSITELQGWELNTALQSIKGQYKTGQIDRDTAQEQSKTIIDEMNRRGKIISKKNGVRFSPITFTYVMR